MTDTTGTGTAETTAPPATKKRRAKRATKKTTTRSRKATTAKTAAVDDVPTEGETAGLDVVDPTGPAEGTKGEQAKPARRKRATRKKAGTKAATQPAADLGDSTPVEAEGPALEAPSDPPADEQDMVPAALDSESSSTTAAEPPAEGAVRKKKRRRRSRKTSAPDGATSAAVVGPASTAPGPVQGRLAATSGPSSDRSDSKRQEPQRGSSGRGGPVVDDLVDEDPDAFGSGLRSPSPVSDRAEASDAADTDPPAAPDKPRRRRRRRRRGKGGAGGAAGAEAHGVPSDSTAPGDSSTSRTTGADAVPTAARAPAIPAKPQPAPAPIAATGTLQRNMLINVSRGEECRIAIVEDGKLDELYYERVSSESHVGNIYKAIVTNVESSIQAAFLDFGLGKNGFLHISDLQPQYFPGDRREAEVVGRKISRRHRPPIQKCLRKGDEVIVQVIKEGIGTKGPTLSTYLSIPGRYLVMMPGMNNVGVSRKIEDHDDRHDMREVLNSLKLPPEMGFILRTAGRGRTKRELQNDLNYLNRLWKAVVKRIKSERGPSLLYKESDLVIRTIRDVVTTDFSRIVVDDQETAENAREFLAIAMPRSVNMVEVYEGQDPLFHRYHIESQIESLYSKHVPLKSGGSLVIESTEALVAIDVNSGRYRAQDNAEATAFRINMEAAIEIAHQLRLRDLGGLIICDFIDMIQEKNKRQVEKTLRDALKAHKERVQILKMSNFGIIEMTRQRQRQSIKRALFADCPHCAGSGLIKSLETQVLDVMRSVQVAVHTPNLTRLTLRVNSEVCFAVLNRKRAALTALEQALGRQISIDADPHLRPDERHLEGVDAQGRPLKLEQA